MELEDGRALVVVVRERKEDGGSGSLVGARWAGLLRKTDGELRIKPQQLPGYYKVSKPSETLNPKPETLNPKPETRSRNSSLATSRSLY
jgi:hypothetical protein